MKRQTFLVRVAIGLTAIAAVYGFAQEPSPLPVEPADPDLVEACVNCHVNGQLPRDKTIDEQACRDRWEDEAPRRWYVGRCVRIECDKGFYYKWEDWIPLDTIHCTDVERNDPSRCPDPKCIYVPWLSEPKSALSVFQSCQGAKGQPLTTDQSSWIINQAMQTNEKR